MSNKMNDQMMPVSIEQSKLLGNPLRIKIIGALYGTAKTSKQVATQIGESPGNVHYHVQKLYQGGLIDLVEEKRVGGVIEKYYLSKAKWFKSDQDVKVFPELDDSFESASATNISMSLQLKESEQEELLNEFRTLLEKWVERTSTPEHAMEEEFVIGLKLVSRKEKQKD
ncbi:ArsR/SmtB family transcription factor [Bacillus horti]|uniref:DNA-binding transcriptional ArsR family regulator n=1 Tax=Caldalkalibacillus horti TaxID=77523 RepID=A0ABT9W5C9_9BACI|nr:helix-turn-helix domain-containing protein [Bacillus horti]MDQ0168459.1 DNA-binding transcriptional ArsR family regulator [Bacillus horti]